MSNTSIARRRAPRSPDFWRNSIAAWRTSGLSAVAFGREHDLHPSSLYKWARRLRGSATQGPASGAPALKSFVPVDVVSEGATASGGAEQTQPVEVVLPHGVVIRIQESVVAQMLPAVLRVVTEVLAC